MKNLLKLLGIIALAAVIGFTMGCKQDEEEDGGGKGNGLEWPPEFLWDTNGLTGAKSGTWSPTGANSTNINFDNGWEDALGDWTDARFSFSKVGGTPDTKHTFYIESIDGKKITVKQRGTETKVVLCTDWTVANDELTLTGGDLAAFNAALASETVAEVPAAVLDKALKHRK